MADPQIRGAVGKPPAPNHPDDVKTVQQLLLAVRPPLSTAVQVTGRADAMTLAGIAEFQGGFMAVADGRVEPGGQTFEHLKMHFAPDYKGCSARQRAAIDGDVRVAKSWLGEVNRRLGSPDDADMRRKVNNVFHVDSNSGTAGAARFQDLRQRFLCLRDSLDQNFPRECVPETSLYAAWVIVGDGKGTMFFPRNYTQISRTSRVGTIIHERAHTVFSIKHAGMRQEAGTIDMGSNPDDDNGFTADEALGNAYCYGWLAEALQPGYAPASIDVIVGSKSKKR